MYIYIYIYIHNIVNGGFSFFVQHIHILRAFQYHYLYYHIHIISVLALKVNIKNCWQETFNLQIIFKLIIFSSQELFLWSN